MDMGFGGRMTAARAEQPAIADNGTDRGGGGGSKR